MMLETGKPNEEGRYLVFASGVGQWLDPCVANWDGENWVNIFDGEPFPKKVMCFSGPFPERKKPPPKLEFDL